MSGQYNTQQRARSGEGSRGRVGRPDEISGIRDGLCGPSLMTGNKLSHLRVEGRIYANSITDVSHYGRP
jgi:hypothetical protein